MSSINSSGQTGNFISRLQGLKNVSGRRVMPGQELMQEPEYEPEPDLKGIAQPEPPRLPEFGNFITPANEPEPDLGGQITSQSYDVRANTSVPMDTQVGTEKSGLFDRLGRGLANAFHPENQELKDQYARFTPEEESLPKEGNYKFLGRNPHVSNTPKEKSFFPGQLESFPVSTPPLEQARTPEEFARQTSENLNKGISYLNNLGKPQEISQEQKALDKEAMDKAQLEPYQIVAYGATDEFANRPELVAKVSEFTGINFNQQVLDETKKYEEILSNIDKGLTEDANYNDLQSKRINERILNNQATDSDKYYIGLALAMPLILGGIFGKEVGLGTLAGGAKGLADVYKGREEGIREDEKLLADINKQKNANDIKKGELEIQRMELPSKIQKNLPKDEQEDLKGMKMIQYKDPNTGEIIAEGPEVLPDLVADLKYANTSEKRKDLRKEAVELEKEKAALERANDATSNIVKAATQLKDTGIFGEILALSLSEESNDATKKLLVQRAPKIMIDGRMQNSAVYLNSQIELVKDSYRRNEQMKAFTATIANHIGTMIENPMTSGLKPQDLIDQVLILRDRAQKFFVDRATGQGFLPEPLYDKFGKLNRELYKGLNKKEEMKELERDKELMYGSE